MLMLMLLMLLMLMLQAAQGRAQSTEQHAQQLGAEGAELRGEVQRLVRLVEEGQVQLAAERGALGEARRQLESMALREQELQVGAPIPLCLCLQCAWGGGECISCCHSLHFIRIWELWIFRAAAGEVLNVGAGVLHWRCPAPSPMLPGRLQHSNSLLLFCN